jgi:phosphoserine phosphatase RsbU/P
MRVLIAEDDPVSRRVLSATLAKWGYEVVVTVDGSQALAALGQPEAPALAVLDWMMPGLDGVEVVRRVRAAKGSGTPYCILLTAKGAREDLVAGLEAGADDYIVKPFDREELRARVRVGARMVEMQQALAVRVLELEQALGQVTQLQRLLPICSYCKRVRDDQNYWQEVEAYVGRHAGLQFSHGICPSCWETVVRPEIARSQVNLPASLCCQPAVRPGGGFG